MISLYKMSYFAEPYSRNKSRTKFVLLCSKIWFKKRKSLDTSDFVKKVDVASLKSVVEKLDIDKLVKVTSSLNSLKRKVDNW